MSSKLQPSGIMALYDWGAFIDLHLWSYQDVVQNLSISIY